MQLFIRKSSSIGAQTTRTALSAVLAASLTLAALPLARAQESATTQPTTSEAASTSEASPTAPNATTAPDAASAPNAKRLEAISVEGARKRSGESLPEVENQKINSGKKTSTTVLEDLPALTQNNYRQALALTPGLLTSEVANQSFASFNYRGVGDPHESFNLLTLQDGLPIAADPYGYPASYYLPSLDYVERIDFIRGGAALQYGPQPGGALNFITRNPSTQPWSVRAKQVGGSRGLSQTYLETSGTQGNTSYLAQINQSQSRGFREANSDFRITGGAAKVARKLENGARLGLVLDLYQSDHGEPGGFAVTSAAGVNGFDGDIERTSLFSDRLRINRGRLELFYQDKILDGVDLNARVYGGSFERESQRQTVGTARAFGGIANGTNNVIANQTFHSLGADVRLASDWQMADQTHTLAGGVSFIGIDSPFREERGASPTASSGELRREVERKTHTTSLFVENRFTWNKFKIVPGARLESIFQEIEELVNVGNTVPLRSRGDVSNVILLGLGIGYELPARMELYANASQGYKPVTYADAIPLATGETASDLQEGRSLALEAGLRGRPIEPLYFDVSVFQMRFENQFGRVGTNLQNVGASKHEGVELALALGLFELLDQQVGTDLLGLGELELFGNASLLSAEFTGGPLVGRRPQYAPQYLVRSGLNYRPTESTKFTFAGTLVDRHFANDDNADNFAIAPYAVWDLIGEAAIWKRENLGTASLVFGVNNLFDRKYTSRIRSNGIEPGLPRNVYAGLQLVF